jgi:hypothetical protein
MIFKVGQYYIQMYAWYLKNIIPLTNYIERRGHIYLNICGCLLLLVSMDKCYYDDAYGDVQVEILIPFY